jgi:hypothetical protein
MFGPLQITFNCGACQTILCSVIIDNRDELFFGCPPVSVLSRLSAEIYKITGFRLELFDPFKLRLTRKLCTIFYEMPGKTE